MIQFYLLLPFPQNTIVTESYFCHFLMKGILNDKNYCLLVLRPKRVRGSRSKCRYHIH